MWTLIQKLQKDSNVSDTFVWKYDFWELHTSLIRGHSRFLKTYHKVKKEYFWEGLKYDVQRFVEKCLVSQQNKVEIVKTPNLLQPLDITFQCWEEVLMNFITSLPNQKGGML